MIASLFYLKYLYLINKYTIMSKTIIFNEPFESKLKELRIKTRFVKNVKDHCKRNNYDLQKHLTRLNQRTTWHGFVDNAFTWGITPESETRPDYWVVIAYF